MSGMQSTCIEARGESIPPDHCALRQDQQRRLWTWIWTRRIRWFPPLDCTTWTLRIVPHYRTGLRSVFCNPSEMWRSEGS